MGKTKSEMVSVLGKLVARCYDNGLAGFMARMNYLETPKHDAKKAQDEYFSQFDESEAISRKYQASMEGFLYDLFEIFDVDLEDSGSKEGSNFKIILENENGEQFELSQSVFDIKFEAGDWIEKYSMHGSELGRMTDFVREKLKNK
jgi:hypothetical protein